MADKSLDKSLDKSPEQSDLTKPNYLRDHKKSMRQVVTEAVTPPTDEPKEVVKEVTPAPEKKEEIKEAPLDTQKIADEAAEKAATKVAVDLKEEIEKIKASSQSKEEKKEAIEELKSQWSKEKRNPRNYDEIFEQAVTTAEERAFNRAKAYFEEQREADKQAQIKQQAEVKQQTEAQKKAHDDSLKAVDTKINDELEELYSGNYIPRPKDENDLTDEGVKVKKALFETGLKVNNQRILEGKPPIDSIAKIFFMHYTPANTQPPGADAPVAGARNTVQKESQTIPYHELHNSSFRQLMNKITKQ